MAIEPNCDRCNDKLNEFGGILLSPPDKENKVIKFHLCIKCYDFIARHINSFKNHILNAE